MQALGRGIRELDQVVKEGLWVYLVEIDTVDAFGLPSASAAGLDLLDVVGDGHRSGPTIFMTPPRYGRVARY
jgi:hypothetical protein